MRLVYLLLAESCKNMSVAALETADAQTRDASPAPPPAPADAPRHALAEAAQHAVHLHLSEHLAHIENLVAGGRQKVGAAHLGQHLPAWCRPTDGEPRWPVALALVS